MLGGYRLFVLFIIHFSSLILLFVTYETKKSFLAFDSFNCASAQPGVVLGLSSLVINANLAA